MRSPERTIAAARRVSVAGVLLATMGLMSCGGDPATPDVPPVVAITATAGTASVLSGGTTQLAATLTDKRGKQVPNATFTWTAADPSVASVSSAGLVRGAKAGTTTVSAAADGAVGTFSVNVIPGAPARLLVNTQPAGGASGARLSTQPAVEVRDAADNLVTAATTIVSVAIGSGGGALSGSVTIPVAQGVARFTDLAVAGLVGPKTLQFSALGLTNVESSPFNITAGPAAAIALVASVPSLRSGSATPTPFVVALRDAQGNDAALAGRRIVASVTGGSGVTAISGATVNTDAQGRAAFASLAVAGLVGNRQLVFRADSITAAVTTSIALLGGRPRGLTFERDAPLVAEIGVPLTPPPVLQLIDSVGNNSAEPRVILRATVVGGATTIANDSVATDSLGRATFSSLVLQGSTGTRTLRFSTVGVPTVSSRSIDVVPPDTTAQPAFITTSLSGTDTTQRVIVLSSPTASLTPFLSARNAQQTPISSAGVRWLSRDPSRAIVAADGRITGLRAGRTFVVAQASRNPAVADSVLVFVPASATGPILRASLPSYRIATDTFSIIVQVESRDGRTFSAADFEVAWPGSNAFPFSPFTVTRIEPLIAGVVTGVTERQENVRVTWATTTPVAGTVSLVRLVCRVNQRNVGNQLVLTLNQLLAGDLSNLTSLTSVFNPIVIIP